MATHSTLRAVCVATPVPLHACVVVSVCTRALCSVCVNMCEHVHACVACVCTHMLCSV